MKLKTIFIIDDDEMFRSMLRDHLTMNPLFNIQTFETGEDAIKNITQNPDVVILDFQLNSMSPKAADGLAILQQIKKMDENISVIMLSSQNHYGKALQTIQKGALEYVIKDNSAFKKIERILEGIK